MNAFINNLRPYRPFVSENPHTALPVTIASHARFNQYALVRKASEHYLDQTEGVPLPKHEESTVISLPLDSANRLCQRVIATDNWGAVEEHVGGLMGKEVFKFWSTKWPVTVNITFARTSNGSTAVTIRGSNGGAGPIQSKHVRTRVLNLCRLIETEASKQPQAVARPSNTPNQEPGGKAATKYCFKCGVALPLEASFCVSCGADLRSVGVPTAPASASNGGAWEGAEIEARAGKAAVGAGIMNSLLGGTAMQYCIFVARARGPDGAYVAAEAQFPMGVSVSIEHPDSLTLQEAQGTLDILEMKLMREGWEYTGTGATWYRRQYRRPL